MDDVRAVRLPPCLRQHWLDERLYALLEGYLPATADVCGETITLTLTHLPAPVAIEVMELVGKRLAGRDEAA